MPPKRKVGHPLKQMADITQAPQLGDGDAADDSDDSQELVHQIPDIANPNVPSSSNGEAAAANPSPSFAREGFGALNIEPQDTQAGP